MKFSRVSSLASGISFILNFLYSSVEMKIDFNGIQISGLVETIITDLASL